MDRYASHKRIVKRQFGGGFDYTSIFGIGDDEEETTTSTSTRTTARPDPETTTTVRTTSKEVEPTTEVTRTPVTTTTARTTETPETTSTTKTPETTRTTTPVTTSTTPTPTTTSTTPTPTSTKVTPTTTSTSTTPTTTERTTTRSTSSSSSSSSSHSTSYYVPSSTSSVADPSATLAEGNNTEQTGGVSSGSIAGIVIGVLLGLAALGILIVFFVRRNRKKQEELNHFNASSFRRSAFLIDDGHEDFNPYAAAVTATQASALGRSPTTMTERQYGTMASVPTPGYPKTPYAQSPGYPIMQQPVNTFSPENYGYMEPVQQFAPNQYAGVGAGASASASNAAGFGAGNAAGFGAGNAAGFGAGNGAGVGAGMGMGSAIAVGGYYPSQGGPKALPDMPVSPNTQDNSFEGPFADSHHVIPAPLPVATAGGAVELERAYSVGSSHEHHYNSAPLNVANPDNNEPVRKLSVKRVPVPTEREEDPTAADLSAFPSPPVQSAPVTLPPVNTSAPAPYSPAPYSPAPYSPAPYTLVGPIHEQQQHIAAPAPVQASAPARSIPSVLTPGGSPSPKRETVYDPEDAYGGM